MHWLLWSMPSIEEHSQKVDAAELIASEFLVVVLIAVVPVVVLLVLFAEQQPMLELKIQNK